MNPDQAREHELSLFKKLEVMEKRIVNLKYALITSRHMRCYVDSDGELECRHCDLIDEAIEKDDLHG